MRSTGKYYKRGGVIKEGGELKLEGELKVEVQEFKKWQVQWLLPWKNGEKIAQVLRLKQFSYDLEKQFPYECS